jgi:hypothetical protein
MDARYRVLHSLNAARVCAEFLVVNFHVSLTPASFLKNDKVAQALMSFFFVLSGFMAMYTNTGTDFSAPAAKMDYISRRLSKTYPTYLIWTLLDLPGTIVKHIQFALQCPLYWISLASQPVLLQAWLGCYHIASSNPVGWYLCTLFWLWFLFPFLPVRKMFASHPWTSVVCLYFASILGFLAFAGFSNMNTRTPPPLRACEFLMGCCMAFTLDKPVNGWLALTGLLGFLAYWISTRAMPELFNQEDVSFTCALWPYVRWQPDPCSLLSTFSIVWCLLVQWLAASELLERDSFILRIMHWDCFKSLSAFSLQLYLSHVTIATGLMSASVSMGIADWWSTDSLILTCYLLAYWYSTIEQPVLAWIRARLTCTK